MSEEQPLIVKLAGWVHTALSFLRNKLALVLPKGSFLGIDLVTLVLVVISLIIAFFWCRKKYTNLQAFDWKWYIIIAGAAFALLRFA